MNEYNINYMRVLDFLIESNIFPSMYLKLIHPFLLPQPCVYFLDKITLNFKALLVYDPINLYVYQLHFQKLFERRVASHALH